MGWDKDQAREHWKNVARKEKGLPPKKPAPANNITRKHVDNGMFRDPDPVNVNLALMALAVCPTEEDAAKWLDIHYDVIATAKSLKALREKNFEGYQKAVQEAAPIREKLRINKYANVADMAAEMAMLAMQEGKRHLEENRVSNPDVAARNYGDLMQKFTEKRRGEEDRPERITEERKPEEIIRQLVAMGVAKEIEVETDADPEN